MKYCLRYIKDKEKAKDLAHDCWIKLHNKDASNAYIRTAIRNTFYNTARKPLTYCNEVWDSPVNAEQEGFMYLEKLILRLPKKYREPLLLKAQGYNITEISERMSLNYDTTKQRILKAKKMLDNMYQCDIV